MSTLPPLLPPLYTDTPAGLRAETLLRNPETWLGDGTLLAPAPQVLTWRPVPLLAREQCDHAETMCTECTSTWALDHYVRLLHEGREVWRSPDHPDA